MSPDRGGDVDQADHVHTDHVHANYSHGGQVAAADHATMPDAPSPDAPSPDAPSPDAPSPDAPSPDARSLGGLAADATTPDGESHTPRQVPMPAPMPMSMQTHGGRTAWPHFANMVLGVWLVASAFALGVRSEALQWSDIASGVAVVALSILALSQRPLVAFWAPWTNALVGLWLLFAPLVFWAPAAASYANDTLTGALVVVFAILAPGMPMPRGMSMAPGTDLPPGWSYNPSSWPQRAPIIALALLGFVLSRQMAAFQLQHIASLTDPFFGLGTQRVLTSDVSRAFPIPDAGLGAVAYMVEFLMGFMGDKRRWRTMPWMVTFFGILVVPLGVVSITLIILQPLAVGAWCTFCLIAAGAMVVMIALTLDEVVAMGQFLAQAHREGQSFWRVVWLGGTLGDPRAIGGRTRPDVVRPMAMVWGVALPWTLVATIVIGLWLMFTPAALGTTGLAAHSDHLVGALIVTFAVMSLADVGRALRFANVAFGAWTVAAPWLLSGTTGPGRWADAVSGALVVLLSLPRGPVGERYGSWERFIR